MDTRLFLASIILFLLVSFNVYAFVPQVGGVYSVELPLPNQSPPQSVARTDTFTPQKIGIYRVKPPAPYYKHRPISGPYFSGNVGYNLDRGNVSDPLLQSGSGAGDTLVYTPELQDWVAQLSLGVLANRFFSVELGWIHFDKSVYRLDSYTGFNKTGLIGTVNTRVDRSAIDLLLKGSWPFGDDGFSAFIAAGAAYERVAFESNYSNLPASNVSLDGLTTPTENQGFVPMVVGGIAYTLTPHLQMTMNYSYLSGKGHIQKNYTGYIPEAHIISLGVIGIL